MDKMSAEQLALLTDEEREGLLEEIDEGEGDDDSGDDGADDTTATAAGAETGDESEGEGDEDGQDEDGADAAAAAAAVATSDAKAAEADATAASVDDAAEDEPEEQAPRWILPADHQTKIDDIEAQKDALTEKFDDGELTGGEYRASMKALEKQADDLKSVKIRAEVARDTAIDTWKGDVADFMSDHPEYTKSKFLRDALDAEVRQLQSTSVNPLNPKILAKAHAKITGEITGAFKTDTTPAGGKTDKGGKKTETTAPAKKRDDPPPTLAHVPASDPTDADDGGEFAHLDRALAKNDSLGYEKALAALPEHKREQYLAQ
jgi:hypothetical protein